MITVPLPTNLRPAPPDVPIAGPGPLSAEHLTILAAARLRARKIRRAAAVATLSGWTMAMFAAITLLGAVFGDLVSLILGLGLAVVTYHELHGAAMLRRFDPAAARRLGYNQIGLGLLLIVYAGYSLMSALRHPVLAAAGGSTGDAGIDATIERISSMATYGLYGGIAVAGVIGPGLTALYYFTRGRLVRRMLEQTPGWVIQAMQATN